MLQRIRAGWKIILGEGGTNSKTIDDSGDAFRYRPSAEGVEQSPCAAGCGCPDAEWCSGVGRSMLRIVPDLDASTADGHRLESLRVAEPDNPDSSMSDAGMSTVEYAVGTR